MKCLLENLMRTVNNNEDYREVLKAKNRVMAGFIVFGVVMLILSLLVGKNIIVAEETEFLSGVYAGIGCGIILAAVINIMKARKLLKEEQLLRKDRLMKYDERTVSISQKSMQSAGLLVSVVAAVGALIGGIFSRVIFWCFWGVLLLFSITYLIFSFYYNKKM